MKWNWERYDWANFRNNAKAFEMLWSLEQDWATKAQAVPAEYLDKRCINRPLRSRTLRAQRGIELSNGLLSLRFVVPLSVSSLCSSSAD